MNRTGMPILKTFVLISIIVGLALVFVEQRLEAQEYDRKIRSLKGEIEKLDLQKQELSMELGREKSRALFSIADSNSLPLSASDVITVNLADNKQETPSDNKSAPSLLSFFFRDSTVKP